MAEPNLRKLAQQGDSKALAALLNQSLQRKSITAKVGLKDDCLQILLESAQIPDQQAMVSFIRKGLINLGVKSIKTVKVYGRQTGEESPAWSKKFKIVPEQEMPLSTEPTDFIDLLSHQTQHETLSSASPEVETPRTPQQPDFQNLQISSVLANHPTSHQPIEPLSIGNVVSTGLVLYRSHLKSYFQIALLSTLWGLLPFLLLIPLFLSLASRVLDLSALLLIVPIWLVLFSYCTAQYFTNIVLISRLGFGELVSKPESVKTARSQLNSRLWSFFLLALLVGNLMILLLFVLLIITTIFSGGLGFILASISPLLSIVVSGFLTFLILSSGITWLYSRLLVAEVVLAVEEGSKVIESTSRSWKLTQNSVFRIQGVVLVAFVVTLPIVLLGSYLPQLLFFKVESGSTAFWILNLITFVFSLISGALITPFWQTLKAVVYYDLRSRREGFGLQLRDSQSR